MQKLVIVVTTVMIYAAAINGDENLKNESGGGLGKLLRSAAITHSKRSTGSAVPAVFSIIGLDILGPFNTGVGGAMPVTALGSNGVLTTDGEGEYCVLGNTLPTSLTSKILPPNGVSYINYAIDPLFNIMV